MRMLRFCSVRSCNAVRKASTLASSAVANGVQTVTLDNPSKRNALSEKMLHQLHREVLRHSEDKAVRVVLIRSSGRVFSAGHDLRELLADSAGSSARQRRVMKLCSQVMQSVQDLPLPVVAEVGGLATAAGCQLVAACDLVIAGQSAQFATPGVLIGLFCSTPAVTVARNLPPKIAAKMLLTGQPISANEAAHYGLISHVVPDDKLQTSAQELAFRLAKNSRATVALGKRTLMRQIELTRDQAYDLSEAAMVANLRLCDAQEGISAFLQKRDPTWSHTFDEVD